jgi:hypothetical protein
MKDQTYGGMWAWDVALTDEEIELLQKGADPLTVRPENLVRSLEGYIKPSDVWKRERLIGEIRNG